MSRVQSQPEGRDDVSGSGMWLQLLIAASAVVYAIFAGRAQASRLRNLREDISHGRMRGFLVVAVVIALILASLALAGVKP